MHGPIRDRLEDLLAAGRSKKDLLSAERAKDLLSAGQAQPYRQEVQNHLTSCTECAAEVDALRSQSLQVANLRAPDEFEPTAGFYARVMQRIEERQGNSFWSIFADATYTRRVALASLTLVLALGGYAATQDMQGGVHGRSAQNLMAFSGGSHYDAPVMGSTSEKRDAVLENFETDHLSNAEGQVR